MDWLAYHFSKIPQIETLEKIASRVLEHFWLEHP
jgi:hypothetical protein